jgi:phospholipase/lecithinase/hemolysin
MSLKFLARLGTHRWRWAAALAGGVLLASCGGGTQIVAFVPTRILAFGDELSTIEADGRKYSINAFKITDPATTPPTESTTELDCTRYPIWVQTVAASFGLAFDHCLGAATAATGQILAAAGAKVADFPTQIAAVQGAALGEKDLALVMFGQNDILELYGMYPRVSESDLMTMAEARAKALGTQINELAKSGPAVVVVTTPDISFSPFALAENVNTGDPSRSALISRLVEKFNNRMSVTLINDGHLIGLAYGDIEMQNVAKSPTTYLLANVVDAACLATAPLPDCNTSTLVGATLTTAAATAYSWLWSDSLHPTPMFQDRLAALASNRAHSNPF